MSAFTFKLHRPTGRYRAFENSHADIKQGGKVCGSISEQRDGQWKIGITVKSEKHHCGWKWVFMKATFPDYDTGKHYVKTRLPQALKETGYNLHHEEP